MRTKRYNIKKSKQNKAIDKLLLLLSFFVYKYLSHHLKKKIRSVGPMFCPGKNSFINSVNIDKYTDAHTCHFIKNNILLSYYKCGVNWKLVIK